MNLLHVVNIYFVIPYFLGDQLLYFQKKGYNEYIICSPSDEIYEYSVSHHFNYKEVSIDRKISIKHDIKSIIEIRKYIKKNKINIVTGHTPKGAFVGMIAARLEKVPKRIYFRHGLVFETSKGLKRKILIAVDKITAKLATEVVNVSPSVAKKSLEVGLNHPSKQKVLSKGTCNGISIKKFDVKRIDKAHKETLCKDLNVDNKSFVIGYTGRLVKDKGIIELLESFELVKKNQPNIKLLMVGMFEKRDSLPINIIERIKNDPDIIHVGYVSYEIIEYYYSLMDIFVLPSYREGFPTSVLEASAMKLPIITTRATGCIDSIIENKTGLFVGHNAKELANAINFFIENVSEKISYGNNGRKFVVENFSSEIIWKEIEKLYKN